MVYTVDEAKSKVMGIVSTIENDMKRIVSKDPYNSSIKILKKNSDELIEVLDLIGSRADNYNPRPTRSYI